MTIGKTGEPKGGRRGEREGCGRGRDVGEEFSQKSHYHGVHTTDILGEDRLPSKCEQRALMMCGS